MKTLTVLNNGTSKQQLQEKIEKLQTLQVIGNAYDDAGIFNTAHEIIIHPMASLDDQIIALKKMDEATGEVCEYDQEAIDEYLELVEGTR